MSGPESSLSSPLTIPMATSSSVAADGGCIPTISTYTQKVKEKELKREKRLLTLGPQRSRLTEATLTPFNPTQSLNAHFLESLPLAAAQSMRLLAGTFILTLKQQQQAQAELPKVRLLGRNDDVISSSAGPICMKRSCR